MIHHVLKNQEEPRIKNHESPTFGRILERFKMPTVWTASTNSPKFVINVYSMM